MDRESPLWRRCIGFSTLRLLNAERVVAIDQDVRGVDRLHVLEGDSDLHVVLQGESDATIIVEFPDGANCAPTSYAPGLMQQARGTFLRMVPPHRRRASGTLQPTHVTVTGPLFMDRVHGQKGVAP